MKTCILYFYEFLVLFIRIHTCNIFKYLVSAQIFLAPLLSRDSILFSHSLLSYILLYLYTIYVSFFKFLKFLFYFRHETHLGIFFLIWFKLLLSLFEQFDRDKTVEKSLEKIKNLIGMTIAPYISCNMNEDRVIMKREITINTLVVCGFAARPPSLVRFIHPRGGVSPLSARLCPPPFWQDVRSLKSSPSQSLHSWFVRSLRYRASYPTPPPSSPPVTFQPSDSTPPPPSPAAACPCLHPPQPSVSRRWRLLDKISSLSHSRESLASSVHPPPPFSSRTSKILPNRLPLLPLFSLTRYL